MEIVVRLLTRLSASRFSAELELAKDTRGAHFGTVCGGKGEPPFRLSCERLVVGTLFQKDPFEARPLQFSIAEAPTSRPHRHQRTRRKS